ncbi:MAG TPA: hypothetical protein VNX01_09030 [Bacteroidia bacterium]|jgi:hypothetical protein|nr:hypothetical protein [Bacteroidia bacterium]
MKNLKRNLSLAILSLASSTLFSQTLDEIVNKHVEAIGGKDNWAKVKSLKMENTLKANGAEIKITIYQVDKKAMRQNIALMGLEGYSILTNTEGWTYMPFQGQTKPEAMTADDVKKAQDGLNLQDEFITYKELSKKLELIGKDDVDGTECFKLKMIDKDATETTYYIDPSNYYVIKETQKMTVNGKEMENSTTYGNYKKLPEGVVYPYSIASGWGEAEVTNLTINPKIDEALFKPTTPTTK